MYYLWQILSLTISTITTISRWNALIYSWVLSKHQSSRISREKWSASFQMRLFLVLYDHFGGFQGLFFGYVELLWHGFLMSIFQNIQGKMVSQFSDASFLSTLRPFWWISGIVFWVCWTALAWFPHVKTPQRSCSAPLNNILKDEGADTMPLSHFPFFLGCEY